MSPTRRGYAVAATCVLAFVAGIVFGARALNAIVVPGVVALLAGWVSVRRRSLPTLERATVRPGFPGDRRTIALDIDTERTTTATVHEEIGAGLSPVSNAPTIHTTLPGRVEYDCVLEHRGEHALGPTHFTLTDAFGLFERDFRVSRTTDVLVYPALYTLSGYARRLLGDRTRSTPLDEREEFDSLREYVPGDRLRDVHWKASAKREEFVVAEFAAEAEAETLSVVAEGAPDRVEEMASATASIVWRLLDGGATIDLSVPNDRLAGADGPTREDVLAVLARTSAGRVATARREAADVLVSAERDETTITFGETTMHFEQLLDREGSHPVTDASGVESPLMVRTRSIDHGSSGQAAADGGDDRSVSADRPDNGQAERPRRGADDGTDMRSTARDRSGEER